MDKLYAPWRDRYVSQAMKGFDTAACVFCTLFDGKESDQERYILHKASDYMVILNLYPYNGGHLLIIPKKHASDFDELSQSEKSPLMDVVAKCSTILKQALNCQGINFGANVGRAAGAGIPEHIHMHVVPRFFGDIGFFTTIGNTKQISVDLEKIYKKLKPLFDQSFAG